MARSNSRYSCGHTYDKIPIRQQPPHLFSASKNIHEQEIPFKDTNPAFEIQVVGSPQMNPKTCYAIPNANFS